MGWYCWWFRNPVPNHLTCMETLQIMGYVHIFTKTQVVFSREFLDHQLRIIFRAHRLVGVWHAEWGHASFGYLGFRADAHCLGIYHMATSLKKPGTPHGSLNILNILKHVGCGWYTRAVSNITAWKSIFCEWNTSTIWSVFVHVSLLESMVCLFFWQDCLRRCWSNLGRCLRFRIYKIPAVVRIQDEAWKFVETSRWSLTT